MSVTARRWVLARPMQGFPKKMDFELKSEILPELKEGEVMYRSNFISVDPCHRFLPHDLKKGDTFGGSCVATIVESRDKNFKKDTKIVLWDGYRDAGIINPSQILCNEALKNNDWPQGPKLRVAPILPDHLSDSLLLGVCGMPGNTAYFALVDVLRTRPGDTVVVTSAAGCTGLTLGQLAKLSGCNVIGFTSTDEKVDFLLKMGFDSAFNYRKVDLKSALKSAAPHGVDCLLDCLGNSFSNSIIQLMNRGGRIAVIGAIDTYNDQKLALQPINMNLLLNELSMDAMVIGSRTWRWQEGLQRLIRLVAENKLGVHETLVQGFEKVPEAFINLFQGTNTGKMVVKV